MVTTTAAHAVHVEHVGAAGGAPARAFAAVQLAETLQGSHSGPGLPTQRVGAAGGLLERSCVLAYAE